MLRQGLQKLPVPPAPETAKETTEKVFSRIDRRRTRRTVVWGGAAIAAVFVSALSGIFPGSQSILPQIQIADGSKQEMAPEPLMIAVNRPVIEIPKAAVTSPEKFVEPATGLHDASKNNFN
jgi:hypothetical protein